MDKIERLQKTIAGEAVDRVPVMCWRHWPGDNLRAADLARATLAYQRTYDWDILRVSPSRYSGVIDYGVQAEWQGALTGEQTAIKTVVHRSLEWTELRPIDPLRGELGKQVQAVQLICGELQDQSVPIQMTIFSPLTQAAMIASPEMMLEHMRRQPDRLHSGLNILTDSTLRLIDALRRLPIAGIAYVATYADFQKMAPSEYETFGLPYDRKILEALPERWWLNTLHLQNSAPMFTLMSSLPIHAIHWDATLGNPEFHEAWGIFKGALCGGISAERDFLYGTPAIIRNIAREAIRGMDSRRLILAPGGPAYLGTALSNVQALRDIVDEIGGN